MPVSRFAFRGFLPFFDFRVSRKFLPHLQTRTGRNLASCPYKILKIFACCANKEESIPLNQQKHDEVLPHISWWYHLKSLDIPDVRRNPNVYCKAHLRLWFATKLWVDRSLKISHHIGKILRIMPFGCRFLKFAFAFRISRFTF